MRTSRLQVAITVVAVGVAVSASARPAGDHEPDPAQSASKVLPASLLSGPRFKVDDSVTVNDYMPRFTIRSDFGEYVVSGYEMVAVRVQEIAALDQLEEISKTEAFAGAMAASAKKTGQAVAHAVEKPKETVEGIPKGVGRFMKGVGKSAKKAGTAAADSVDGDDEGVPSQNKSTEQKAGEAAKSVTGASKAKRGLAKKFQVDPYSNNAALQKRLDDLAMAMSAGGLAMNVVNPIPLASSVASVNNLVWDVPAPDLKAMNDKKLAALGVTPQTRKLLFANSFFTPSQQTGFVTALASLTGVAGADKAVELAARRADSEDDARFFRRCAEILARAHKQSPLASLEARRSLFVATSRAGALVVPAAVDYLTWTEAVDAFSAEPVPGAKTREVWLSGQASDKAGAELKARGWAVKERVLGAGGR